MSELPEIVGYSELEEIGSGGYSRVYRALQHEFRRPVAIKVLNEPLRNSEAVNAFERECHAMGLLWDHPSIVPVFASAFTSDERPCIVMKLFQEGSYSQILQNSGPIELKELLHVGVQIAGALEAAHLAGVTHGDVKPHNIFKSSFGEPALGDFGIARFVGLQDDATPRALSVHYAAPESIEEWPGPSADQYSLAATLFTMALGRRPFEPEESLPSDSSTKVLMRVLESPTPRLPEQFDSQLVETIRRAMDRDPDQRFPDMASFGAALSRVGLQDGDPALRAQTMSSEFLAKSSDDNDLEAESSDEDTATGEDTNRPKERTTDKRTGWQRFRQAADSRAQVESKEEGAEVVPGDKASSFQGHLPSVRQGTAIEAVASERSVKALICNGCERTYPLTATECSACSLIFNPHSSGQTVIPQPILGSVEISGGTIEVLDADLVIGRNPAQQPLLDCQRSIVHGEGDLTVSRRHIELVLDGWNVVASVVGQYAIVERDTSSVELWLGDRYQLQTGDTLYFGKDSWLRLVPNTADDPHEYSTPQAEEHTATRSVDSPVTTNVAEVSNAEVEVSAPTKNTGTVFTNENSYQRALIRLSGGTTEEIKSNLVIGRNPTHEALLDDQRAVVHGASDRTVSRRQVELLLEGNHVAAVSLGRKTLLERGGMTRELSCGEREPLESGDVLHYGTSCWLRLESDFGDA